MPLAPNKKLEETIRIVDFICRQFRMQYWLAFGGLIAIEKKNGVIPDGDLDFCTFYENSHNWEKIVKKFESHGFAMSKALLNDTDVSRIVYFGFNHRENKNIADPQEQWPHICFSFWYLHNGIRYFCHDEKREVKMGQSGVPASGYYFKGVPDNVLNNDLFFKYVEWPGIPGQYKVKVPVFAGAFLDLYPCWAYNKQKYIVENYKAIDSKLDDVCKSSAISRYMVHVKSMNQWNDPAYISEQLKESEQKWLSRIKMQK